MILATLLALALPQGLMDDPLLPKLTPNDLYLRFSASVATVSATDADETVSQGTGWLLSPTKLVTCAHVVKDASKIDVIFTPGFDHNVKVTVAASLLAEDSQTDVAILKLERKVSAKPLNAISNPFAFIDVVGTTICVIGSPRGIDLTLSTGIVSNTHGENPLMLQITAPVSHGSSGSPVLNNQGNVIGMVQSTVAEGELLNLAISSQSIDRKFDSYVRFELDSMAIERERARVMRHFGKKKPGASSYELRRLDDTAAPVLSAPRTDAKRVGVLLPRDVVSIVSIVGRKRVPIDKTDSYLQEWAKILLPNGKFGYVDVAYKDVLSRRLALR